jgi:Putative Actinobacterial Holin-X, holin superfamily III
MAEPAVRRTSASGTDQSIGDLVSVAARDISQLVRYELDLAKIELKNDVKRVAIGGALLVMGGFSACLMLMVLCFAYAYGLRAAFGLAIWQAFLCVFGTLLLFAGLALLVARGLLRKMTGLSKTRRGLAEGLSVLRRGRAAGSAAKAAGPAAKAAGPAAKAEAGARAG